MTLIPHTVSYVLLPCAQQCVARTVALLLMVDWNYDMLNNRAWQRLRSMRNFFKAAIFIEIQQKAPPTQRERRTVEPKVVHAGNKRHRLNTLFQQWAACNIVVVRFCLRNQILLYCLFYHCPVAILLLLVSLSLQALLLVLLMLSLLVLLCKQFLVVHLFRANGNGFMLVVVALVNGWMGVEGGEGVCAGGGWVGRGEC